MQLEGETMSKHKNIRKKDRLIIYQKYNGHCAYCGCEIEYNDMQVDHIKSVYSNTDYKKIMTDKEMYSLENYMPACRQCNFYKSTFDIETFRKRLTDVMIKNLQKNFNYRLAIKYGLIYEDVKPVKFYFEQFD